MATQAQKDATARARAARKADLPDTPSEQAPETPPDPPVATEPPDKLEAVVESIVAGVSPGRAAEEADAALVRSRASGSGEQAELERRIHQRLTEVAERHNRELAANAATQARVASTVHQGPDGGPAEPIPDDLRRGMIVHVHQDPRRPDTPAMVLRLHPRVRVGDSEHRWRADLAVFPLHGSPSVADNIPYGHGVGQFSKAPDDEDDIGVSQPEGQPAGTYEKPWESKI